jgi:hypothetical protein
LENSIRQLYPTNFLDKNIDLVPNYSHEIVTSELSKLNTLNAMKGKLCLCFGYTEYQQFFFTGQFFHSDNGKTSKLASHCDVRIFEISRVPHDAKYTKWLIERQEITKRPTIRKYDETILSRKSRNQTLLTEGMTSNIIILKDDGTLQASKHIDCLEGSMLKWVKIFSQQLEIPWIEEEIYIENSHQWVAMFLVSVGRTLQSVNAIYNTNEQLLKRFDSHHFYEEKISQLFNNLDVFLYHETKSNILDIGKDIWFK